MGLLSLSTQTVNDLKRLSGVVISVHADGKFRKFVLGGSDRTGGLHGCCYLATNCVTCVYVYVFMCVCACLCTSMCLCVVLNSKGKCESPCC